MRKMKLLYLNFQIIYHSTEKERYLMISQNKMKSVPIIVNRCDYHKQHEYFFEEPDYETLGDKV